MIEAQGKAGLFRYEDAGRYLDALSLRTIRFRQRSARGSYSHVGADPFPRRTWSMC